MAVLIGLLVGLTRYALTPGQPGRAQNALIVGGVFAVLGAATGLARGTADGPDSGGIALSLVAITGVLIAVGVAIRRVRQS